MSLARHWKKLLLLSLVGVAALTFLSISQMEDYLRESFVFWIYLFIPIVAYGFGVMFVWIGVHIMRYNDIFLGTSFQLTGFLWLNVIVGCSAMLIDVVQLFRMQSGYMPMAFAVGSGILWIACYFKTRICESGPRE